MRVDSTDMPGVIESEWEAIEALARVEAFRDTPSDIATAVTLVVGNATVSLRLGDQVDLAAERQRLQGELLSTADRIQQLQKRLADGQFTTKAPEEVVERERQRLSSLEERQAKVEELLGQLGD